MSSLHEDHGRRFLSALLSQAQEEPKRFFYLWDLATKSTSSYRVGGLAAVEQATTWSVTPTNLYVGVAMSEEEIPSRERLKNNTAAGLYGVYLDIDVVGPAHQKTNLPPSTEAGFELLHEFGVAPTLVVDSGHGLQPWWLFTQPWIFESEAARKAAAQLTRDWVTAHRVLAAQHGWDHDSVGDLARVLRLPGTINGKIPEAPARVTLVSEDGPRYTASDLDELIEAARNRTHQRSLTAFPPAPADTDAYAFTVDPNAEAPPEKLQRLLQNSRAAASWDHARSDFQDQSPSSYDLSLASFAVRDGWEDQEVVDLLVAARRRNRSPVKLRPDYYRRTVDTARATTEAEEGEDNLEPSLTDTIKEIGLSPALADVVEDVEHFAQGRDGSLHRYDRGRYVDAERWMAREARTILELGDATKHWGPHVARNVLGYVGCFAPFLWDRPPSDRLNVINGLVDIDTGTLFPHSPDHRSVVQLPVEFDPSATCPAIDEFVRQTFPEDAFDSAFELLALAMVPDPSIQKVVLLLGPGGNGKSVFLRLLQRFLGPENYSTVPLQRLEDDRFSASRLHGKLANICADLPSTDLVGTSMLKGITGGDRITVERKYHDSYDLEPYCKLVFSANTPPRTPDSSEGFFQRWLVLLFERSFRGEVTEIPSALLDARLQTPQELSGALNRALHARRRMEDNGLSEPLSCVTAKEAFRAVTDPVSVWIDQRTVHAPGAFEPKRRLLEEYNSHAIRLGQGGMTAQRFGRALRRSRPDLQDGQRLMANRRVEVWLDLALRDDTNAYGASGQSGVSEIGAWGG